MNADNTTAQSMLVKYCGQSAFVLEFPSATFVFDWKDTKLPVIRNDKPLYIFISHAHADHFNPKVFDLVPQVPHAEIWFGYSPDDTSIVQWLQGQYAGLCDRMHFMKGGLGVASADGAVRLRTFFSTDLGVAYLVIYEGRVLYHAGDLFLMPAKTQAAREEFLEYTEPLRGMRIDYAMIPMDPRTEDVAYLTIKRYMELAAYGRWSPMHLWGQYDYPGKFAAKYPDLAKGMINVALGNILSKDVVSPEKPPKVGEKFEVVF